MRVCSAGSLLDPCVVYCARFLYVAAWAELARLNCYERRYPHTTAFICVFLFSILCRPPPTAHPPPPLATARCVDCPCACACVPSRSCASPIASSHTIHTKNLSPSIPFPPVTSPLRGLQPPPRGQPAYAPAPAYGAPAPAYGAPAPAYGVSETKKAEVDS